MPNPATTSDELVSPMEPFVLRRADVEEKVGACGLIALFDRPPSANADPNTERSATEWVFPRGWGERQTANLMAASPRALWLMAKGGVIPVTEEQALTAILKAGKTIEPLVRPVAQVQTFPPETAALFALRAKAGAFGRRLATAEPTTPAPVVTMPV